MLSTSRTALLWMLAWLGGSVIVAAAADAQTVVRKLPDLAEATRLVIEGSNEFRRDEGAGPTRPDAQLGAAARSLADFMARTDRYGHDADGKQPATRAQEQGYRHCIVLENIATLYHSDGFDTRELTERVLQGWKLSPGHRKNLLDRDVTDIAVAIARSETSGKYYAVQMLGLPQDKRIEFRIANATPLTIEYELAGKPFSLPEGTTRTHQNCRASKLIVKLPGEQQGTVVRPANGERYEIERAGSRYRLKKG